MKPTKDYLLNFIAQGGSRALAMASGFIVFVILARVLGAEALGHYAFVMAFIVVAGNFAEFGITTALSKDLPRIRDLGDGDAAIYFGNYLILRALLSIVVLAAALIIVSVSRPAQAEPLLIGCLSIPFIGARFCETVYQIYQRPAYTLYTSIWLAISQLLVAGILLLKFRLGVTGYMYGFVVTQLLYFALCIYLAGRLVLPRFRLRRQIIAEIAVIALPVGFWSLFNIVSTKADVFLLTYLRTSHELGIYNVAYRLLDLGTALAVTAATPLVPVLARKFQADAQSARQDCLAIVELSLALLLPVPLLLPHLAPLIVTTIFGEAFAAAIPLVGLFGWVFLLMSTMYICMSINLAAGNLQYAWWSGLLAAVTNVLLNLLLIPRWGATGAAFSALASNGLMLVVSLYFVRVNIGRLVSVNKLGRIALAAAVPALTLHYAGSGFILFVAPVALLLYLAALMLLDVLPRRAIGFSREA